MGNYSISKEDMLEILGDRDADVSDDTVITEVNLTENAVEFTLEEKEKEAAGEG